MCNPVHVFKHNLKFIHLTAVEALDEFKSEFEKYNEAIRRIIFGFPIVFEDFKQSPRLNECHDATLEKKLPILSRMDRNV